MKKKRQKKRQLRLIPGGLSGRARLSKTAYFSIAVNVLEIVAGIAMTALVHGLLRGGVGETAARMISLLCLTVVGWGAITDIGSALSSLQMVRRTRELEEAYGQLESLNRELRAQRHDFLNHLQVVYSLIEMNEPGEATAYMDKLYGDMQRVSRMMRTGCPAVNALIQAKTVEAEQRGATLRLSIAAKWDEEGMPAWEICRVLANLLDNALDAATQGPLPEGERPAVELVLGEDLRSWFFSVRNNGPAIPPELRERVFEPGFTTKATGQGMGLYIVGRTLAELGGRVTLESRDGDTVFSGFVPKKRLQIAETPKDNDEHAKKDDEKAENM